jgi:hypothetical protein
VARYDFPPELRDGLPLGPLVTRIPSNAGRGRSYGFELLLARRRAAPAGKLDGWLAYSFGVARRAAHGFSYPFDFDRRHAVSLVGSFRPSTSLELSATVRAASGFPWTAPLGMRVSAVADADDRDGDGDSAELVPRREPAPFSGSYIRELDFGGLANRNRDRGPWFSRVDLRLAFRPGGGRFTFYLDVINALRHRNTLFPDYEWHVDPSGRGQARRRRQGTGLPLVPSLGIHVRF